MQFNEIFEKTKYAFEHDEVFELLYGEKGYAYQAPMVPVSIPTHIDAIFDKGIYPYYSNSSNLEKEKIVEKIALVLQRTLASENPVYIWWALAIVFCQKLNEIKYKDSPFIFPNSISENLKQSLLANKEKLKKCTVYAGANASEGLWNDVLRYDSLYLKYFNNSILR